MCVFNYDGNKTFFTVLNGVGVSALDLSLGGEVTEALCSLDRLNRVVVAVSGSDNLNICNVADCNLKTVYAEFRINNLNVMVEDSLSAVVVSDNYGMNTAVSYNIGVLSCVAKLICGCIEKIAGVFHLTVGGIFTFCDKEILDVIKLMDRHCRTIR